MSTPGRRLTNPVKAVTFTPTGFGGSTAPARFVGGTTSGAPATGTYVAGDFVVSADGRLYVCSASGTPGTWTAQATKAEVDALTGRVAALETATHNHDGVYAGADHGHGVPEHTH